MYVLALSVELHIPASRSLKAKRSALKPIVEGLRRRHLVSMAEVDNQDTWQRASLGLAVVASSAGQAEEQIDEAERFVWSFPEVQVLAADRHWLELDR